MAKIKYYYTLKEMLEHVDAWDDAWEIGQETASNSLYNMLVTTFTSLASTDATKKTESNTLWIRYIAPTFMNSYTLVREEELVYGTTIDDNIAEWLRKLIYLFNQTYDEFKERIDYWTNARGNLMGAIKSTSVNRFNDTPQNGGDYSSDSYTSTYAKSEVENDSATKVERLTEIDKKIKDEYGEWMNREFTRLFIL